MAGVVFVLARCATRNGQGPGQQVQPSIPMITNQEKKLRGTALTLYKETLSKQGLSQIQKDILIGTLLGDASMQAMKGNQESHVKFEQVIRQIDYINHLYEHFHDWVGTPPQIRNIKGGNAADRQSI